MWLFGCAVVWLSVYGGVGSGLGRQMQVWKDNLSILLCVLLHNGHQPLGDKQGTGKRSMHTVL